MRRSLLTLIAAVVALNALTGCIDREVTLFVNPDGSGKIIAVIPEKTASKAAEQMGNLMQAGLMRHLGLPEDTPIVKTDAVGFISKAKGVDAWTDAMPGKTEDGREALVLRGYFKNLNQLVIPQYEVAREDGGPVPQSTLAHQVAADGSQMIGVRDWDHLVKSLGEADTSDKSIVGRRLAELNIKLKIRTSGAITEGGAFTVSDGNLASMQITGAQLGKGTLLSGKPGIIKVASGRPLFDYEKEKAMAISKNSAGIAELQNISNAIDRLQRK